MAARLSRPMRVRWSRLVSCGGLLCLLLGAATPLRAATVTASWVSGETQASNGALLSPFWDVSIQRWALSIDELSKVYGFHPDFIAAVIKHESDPDLGAMGRVRLASLMGARANGPGSGWELSSEQYMRPSPRLRWGVEVLSNVVQQSGGDLYTALAAYRGGWQHVGGRVPREYAARVLDSYARALLSRAELPAETAARWTIAVDIRAGNVPAEARLILGHTPISPVRVFVPHTVYASSGPSGKSFYVRAFVVPVGLLEVAPETTTDPDRLEPPLRARLGEKGAQMGAGGARVLLACLPRLARLRGQTTTRWYGPSGCPMPGR